MEPSQRNWPDYYWKFCKYFGKECYRTWRWELFSAVLVGFFTFVLAGNWKDFRTALLATALTLACLVLWHLVRLPWLLHRALHEQADHEPAFVSGFIGILVFAGLVFGAYKGGEALWNTKPLGELKVTFPSPADPAAQVRIAQLENQIATIQHLPTTKPPQQITPIRPCRIQNGDDPFKNCDDRQFAQLMNGLIDRIYPLLDEWRRSLQGPMANDPGIVQITILHLHPRFMACCYADALAYRTEALRRLGRTEDKIGTYPYDQIKSEERLGPASFSMDPTLVRQIIEDLQALSGQLDFKTKGMKSS